MIVIKDTQGTTHFLDGGSRIMVVKNDVTIVVMLYGKDSGFWGLYSNSNRAFCDVVLSYINDEIAKGKKNPHIFVDLTFAQDVATVEAMAKAKSTMFLTAEQNTAILFHIAQSKAAQ